MKALIGKRKEAGRNYRKTPSVNIRKADALTIINYKKSFYFIILVREVEIGELMDLIT